MTMSIAHQPTDVESSVSEQHYGRELTVVMPVYNEEASLPACAASWLDALDSVQPFVASRPAQEIGCLYYSASRRAFVDPRQVADSVPHFGRPGGVLPRAIGP